MPIKFLGVCHNGFFISSIRDLQRRTTLVQTTCGAQYPTEMFRIPGVAHPPANKLVFLERPNRVVSDIF